WGVPGAADAAAEHSTANGIDSTNGARARDQHSTRIVGDYSHVPAHGRGGLGAGLNYRFVLSKGYSRLSENDRPSNRAMDHVVNRVVCGVAADVLGDVAGPTKFSVAWLDHDDEWDWPGERGGHRGHRVQGGRRGDYGWSASGIRDCCGDSGLVHTFTLAGFAAIL